MDITRKDFLKGAIGLAAEITLSPISRTASGVLAAGLATRSATATPIVLVGADSTEEYVYGAGSPNIVVSSLFTAVASGTATSMSIHLNLESGNPIKLSIWTADGLTKLGETVPFADEVGVQTANLISGVAIVSGTTYLLAAMSSGAYIWVNNDGTGWHDFTADATYPNWPASIPHYTNSGGGKVAIWAGAESSAATFDFYISPTGSDSNDGSATNPWAITALNTKRAAYTGKRVGLMNGTYNVHSYLSDTSDAPGCDLEGGSALSPTVIAAVNPRQAIINAKNGSVYGGAKRGNFIGHTPARAHQGYITIDGLKFTGFTYLCLNIGIYNTSVDIPGIVIKNCEFTDNNASQIGFQDNVASITLNNCLDAVVQNCKLHDNVSWDAGNADHLAAILLWQCKGTLIEHCTVINAGAIFGKEGYNQGSEVRYCYVDNTDYPDGSAYALQDFSGAYATGLTLTSRFHHNVLISSGAGFEGTATLNSAYGWRTPMEFYNNTVQMVQYGSSPPPYVESALAVRAESPAFGAIKVYNNIITGVASIDAKMVRLNPKAHGIWDYNLFPASDMTWRLADDTTGATVDDYTSLSAVQSAITTAGGASFETHSVLNDTPGFTNTGSLAERFKLAGGSPAIGTGKSNGTTGGTACDMGAWGNVPPTRIGSDF